MGSRLPFLVPFAIASALSCAIGPSTGSAQTTRENVWVADGEVRCAARSGNVVYIGGNFTAIGPPLGTAVPFDATTGQPLLTLQVVGEVHAVVSDGAGGWYLGGLFDHVKGQPNPGRIKITQERVEPRADEAALISAAGRQERNAPMGALMRSELPPWMREIVRSYFLKLRTQSEKT